MDKKKAKEFIDKIFQENLSETERVQRLISEIEDSDNSNFDSKKIRYALVNYSSLKGEACNWPKRPLPWAH